MLSFRVFGVLYESNQADLKETIIDALCAAFTYLVWFLGTLAPQVLMKYFAV